MSAPCAPEVHCWMCQGKGVTITHPDLCPVCWGTGEPEHVDSTAQRVRAHLAVPKPTRMTDEEAHPEPAGKRGPR